MIQWILNWLNQTAPPVCDGVKHVWGKWDMPTYNTQQRRCLGCGLAETRRVQ